MMLKEKHDQWVLETVDCLRQRKARPDLERIGRMVERFHGLTFNETKESLQRLTDEGVVVKVYFKGNISYRHVRKLDRNKEIKMSPTNQVYNTSQRIAHAIRSIVKQTGDRASFSDLEAWLISKNPETRLVKHRLQTALNREKDSGNVAQFPDGTYDLTEVVPQNDSHPKTDAPDLNKNDDQATPPDTPKKKADVLKPETASSETCTVNRNENSKREVEGSPKRGRPLSKRKKFKKTHGPDFENPLQVKKTYSKDDEKPAADICGYCSKTADSNNEGKMEPLLSCRDCESKAHPSCMDYSPDLARRALDSPWQCMDCKTCFVCDGSENAELMLFCDACDKGYHMTCHEPPLVNKPKGKWICSLCREEVSPERKSQDQMDSVTKQNNKKGVTRADRISDESLDGEDDETKKSKKRKLSRQKSSQPAKRTKSEATSDDNSIGMTSKQSYDDYADGTVGPACFLTPCPSPRPGDTFEYELKMSRLGFPSSIVEDNTTYSDASNWNTDDVVKFFEDCGFQDQAQAFKDQEIDGPSLLLMQRNDVLTGLGLKLGPALKIYHKVVRLQIFSQVSSL